MMINYREVAWRIAKDQELAWESFSDIEDPNPNGDRKSFSRWLYAEHYRRVHARIAATIRKA